MQFDQAAIMAIQTHRSQSQEVASDGQSNTTQECINTQTAAYTQTWHCQRSKRTFILWFQSTGVGWSQDNVPWDDRSSCLAHAKI